MSEAPIQAAWEIATYWKGRAEAAERVRERVETKLAAWQKEAAGAVEYEHRKRCQARVEVLTEVLAMFGKGE